MAVLAIGMTYYFYRQGWILPSLQRHSKPHTHPHGMHRDETNE
jgi:hypothetical protein